MPQLKFRRVNAMFGVALLLWPIGLLAQDLPVEQPVPALAPNQLDDLIAPIALYPDQLLGEVLAASTYPLEIVEAQQWLLENRALIGTQLIDAARQQNWDPSVQALVAFPSALRLLSENVRWTADLGNAFLAQQADVMDAVQRMRASARDNGRLVSTPQQTVTMDQSAAIEIQPVNPQVVYVPYYNPAYVWGAPAYGAYPALGYPDTGSGIGFDLPALLGTLFSGLMSFGGWGWGLNWLSHLLFLNNLFFGHFGFGGGFGGGGFGAGATSAWVHSPGHRLGVAYPNRALATRYAGARSAGFATGRAYSARAYNSYNARSYSSPRSSYSSGSYNMRPSSSYSRLYNTGSAYSSRPSSNYARPSSNYSRGYASPSRETSRYSAPSRSYATNSFKGSSHYSAPKMSHYSAAKAPHYSAPKMPRMKAPKAPHMSSHGGGHSSGGHSGGKHR